MTPRPSRTLTQRGMLMSIATEPNRADANVSNGSIAVTAGMGGKPTLRSAVAAQR